MDRGGQASARSILETASVGFSQQTTYQDFYSKNKIERLQFKCIINKSNHLYQTYSLII